MAVSKKMKEALSKYDRTQEYTLEKATELVKEISFEKFDASVDLDIRLGVTLVKRIKWFVVW